MTKLKFARCIYASFEDSNIELKMRRGALFLVTPKIAESKVFRDSINTKNFEYVEIHSVGQLKKVIGINDAMIEDFVDALQAETEALSKAQEEEDKKRAKLQENARRTKPAPEEKPAEPETPDEPEPPAKPVAPKPDLKGMSYRDAQTYAKELEKKFKVNIDRSAKMVDLKKEIKQVLAKHGSGE